VIRITACRCSGGSPCSADLSAEEGLEPALSALREALAVLGIGEDDLTAETYTGAVLRARACYRTAFPPGRDSP
jgi:hypothetical protein